MVVCTCTDPRASLERRELRELTQRFKPTHMFQRTLQYIHMWVFIPSAQTKQHLQFRNNSRMPRMNEELWNKDVFSKIESTNIYKDISQSPHKQPKITTHQLHAPIPTCTLLRRTSTGKRTSAAARVPPGFKERPKNVNGFGCVHNVVL